jgi:hypothetical protein
VATISLKKDSRHVYALTALFTGIFAACKTDDFQLMARQGYASFRQSYPQSDNDDCDLRHNFAVWQRYALFRFVPCNPQQRNDLT